MQDLVNGRIKWNKRVLWSSKEREAPMYEKWYEGSLNGDLLFAAKPQCMDVNARSYR